MIERDYYHVRIFSKLFYVISYLKIQTSDLLNGKMYFSCNNIVRFNLQIFYLRIGKVIYSKQTFELT